MTTIEKGSFLGLAGGAIAGAILCKPYGVGSAVAGAVAGGILGLFAGIGLVYAQVFVRAVARIYWEVLTGRRKLPDISESSETQRRRLLGFIAFVCIAAELVLAGIYFAGDKTQRAIVPAVAAMVLAASLTGLIILSLQYRRHPSRREGLGDK